MADPIFWLGLSILLVAVSLTAVLIVALPALRELARAARSAEKLFDTLNRELPPTLEAIRLTGLEISDLTDEVSEGVENVGQAAQQVNQSISSVRQSARQAQVTTRSVFAGVRAAWKVFQRTSRRTSERLPPSSRRSMDLNSYSRSEFIQRQDAYSEEPDGYWSDPSLTAEADLEETQQMDSSSYLRSNLNPNLSPNLKNTSPFESDTDPNPKDRELNNLQG